VFYLDSTGNYRSAELDAFRQFVYGFGTRHSSPNSESGQTATLHQIHSATVFADDGRTGCLGDGDALLSQTSGRLVAVKTADCLPILLFDPVRNAVAAIHAGWRGTVRQICRQTADAMCHHFGSEPGNLYAAIGPGIGVCCFEVGPEVSAEFGESGRIHIDLAAVNRRQLLASGIPERHILNADLCTACATDQFWSYRRQKSGAGRMLSFVGIR
jgi:YfiH family protein